jgi:hypothetical protein
MSLFSANITGYISLTLIAAACTGAAAAFIVSGIKMIRRQIKLNNSITLVNLRSTKGHYVFFMSVIAVFIIAASVVLLGGYPLENELLSESFGFAAAEINTAFLFLLLFLFSLLFLLTVLLLARSAVVDKGVYTALNYLDWHRVHDYIIDETKGVVILSSARETFYTIKGTTAPLKVKKEDIPKLKFILNRNKNKFSI